MSNIAGKDAVAGDIKAAATIWHAADSLLPVASGREASAEATQVKSCSCMQDQLTLRKCQVLCPVDAHPFLAAQC